MRKNIVTSISIFVFLISCSPDHYNVRDSRMDKIVHSPQYKEGKFSNEIPWEQPSFSNGFSIMWDFLFKGDQRTPDSVLPRKNVDIRFFNDPGKDQLNVTWLGHSSLMINIDGYKILTDPVFENKVTFFGPSRYNGDIPLDIDQVSDVDVVIISHNHFDHLNHFSIRKLDEKVKQFIVPLGVGAILEAWGVQRAKITELDWWDSIPITDEFSITATPAQHFSGRGLTDRNETLWASWVIKGPKHKIFFSGDSGYFEGFKQIGEKFGPFDITFLETGAYNENWHHIHMFPEETVQASIDLKGKILHPIHWATFNLSLHSWFDPMERLTRAADSLNVQTALPVVGETTVFGKYIPQKKWWQENITRKNEND